jgi:predicted nucleotidyltransferase
MFQGASRPAGDVIHTLRAGKPLRAGGTTTPPSLLRIDRGGRFTIWRKRWCETRRAYNVGVSHPTAAETAARLDEYFRANPGGIAAAYLFGSVARGTAHDRSDVDVAVLLKAEPSATLDGLRTDLGDGLEEFLGRRVDLVILNRAPVDLAHRVLRDGILVCDADTSARIGFEVRARNEFFDLEPYLREYRRAG